MMVLAAAFTMLLVSGRVLGAPINDKFQAYGLFLGLYASPQYLADECAQRYPSISNFAASTKRSYIQKNQNLFASTEAYMVALVQKERGASLEDFKELIEQVKPELDRNVKIGMQPYVGTQNLCSAALTGVNQGKLDLSTPAAKQQLEIIYR